ncbi:membrane protein insertase YidC [Blautia luti]|jgi:YidC/Oxa1 family membrane protein insertase
MNLEMILATKSSTPIIGQLATVMGWIMDGIYRLLNVFGIQNVGLCIIIFSILIYALMTPLQIKQQKFSKLSAIMQPELQKIQKKYKGKNDQASMQKMQEETQAVYQKYGVSPTGSCVQLAIQFPILMALYQVIYKIPAYVGSVKDILASAVTNITGVNGYTEILQQFITDNKMARVQLVMDGSNATSNSVTDFLYALSPSQWKTLAETSQFSGFADTLNSTAKEISHVQNFFGLNIADQPLTYIKAAFVGGSILIAIVAILIPILAWATQMINLKLMPSAAQQGGDAQQDAMMNSMKTMNMVMPLMSAVFCFTFPVGLGIYWVASAAVRSVQQLIINKHMNKIQIEDLISENMKKMEKKREKAGLPPQKITNQAHQSVKNINKIEKGSSNTDAQTRAKKVEESYKNASNAKPGSITAKANMVKAFDERNKKK